MALRHREDRLNRLLDGLVEGHKFCEVGEEPFGTVIERPRGPVDGGLCAVVAVDHGVVPGLTWWRWRAVMVSRLAWFSWLGPACCQATAPL